MADQNESNNKRGMNMIADDIDQSHILTELERIGARASRKGIQRSTLEERIKSEGKLLNSLLDEGRKQPEITSSPFYQEQVPALRESIKKIRTQMNTLDTTARTRAESEASTYIARQFTPTAINAQVSGVQKQSTIQNRAFSMAGQSFDELEAQRQEVLADIRVRERNAQNEIKGMYSGRGQVDPEKSAALGVMLGGTQDQFKKLATINAAQAYQRASGVDPNSKMRDLATMGDEATKMLSAEEAAREVQGGGVQIQKGGKLETVANKDVDRELMNQARELSKALKELAEGAGKTDEELAKLRTSADESAANMKKLQEAQRAGSGGSQWNAGSVLNGLAGGFNAIGGAAQQILINQRMQETANTSGYANLANQQYDMYQKARGGDIASQLALGQFGEADQFGKEMKRATNVVQTAYIAGGAAQVGAGMVKAAEAGAQKFNPGSYLAGTSTSNTEAVINGIQSGIQGGAQMATTGIDMAKGVSAEANRLAGIQANMQARQAIQAVGARQAQGLRDFYTGMDVSVQGAGSQANEILQRSTSQQNIQDMQSARLSPEQFAKLAQQGVQGMGSTFNIDSIYQARQLERGGFGSAQENMQRMATLSQAGGNNPQASMAGVLEAAFTKSLDSSKSLNMMVEHTAAMAAGTRTAAVGIDATAASATMLAAGVDSRMGNKEAALQQAIEASQITAGITTNTSATFSGMVNTAAISQKTGISGDEAIIAQGGTIQEYKALQGKSPQEQADYYKNLGINIKPDKAENFTKEMLRQKQMQILRDKGMALNMQDTSGLLDKINNGENLSDAEQLKINKAASLSGYKGGGAQLLREIKGVTAVNSQEGIDKAADALGKNGDKPDDLKKQLDNLRTSGFKQLSEAAGQAASNLEKFGGALKVFTDLQNKYESGGQDNEATFQDAAGKFATEFTASIGKFDKATGAYEEASKKMLIAANLLSNGIPGVPNFITTGTDNLNQRAGSQKGTK